MEEMEFEYESQRRGSKAKSTRSKAIISPTKPGSATHSSRKHDGSRRVSTRDGRPSTRDRGRKPSAWGGGTCLLEKPLMGGRKQSRAATDKMARSRATVDIRKASQLFALKEAYGTSSDAGDDDLARGVASSKSPTSPERKKSIAKPKQPEVAPQSKEKGVPKAPGIVEPEHEVLSPPKDTPISPLSQPTSPSMEEPLAIMSPESPTTTLITTEAKPSDTVPSEGLTGVIPANLDSPEFKSPDTESDNKEHRNISEPTDTFQKEERRSTKTYITDDLRAAPALTSTRTLSGTKSDKKRDAERKLSLAAIKREAIMSPHSPTTTLTQIGRAHV